MAKSKYVTASDVNKVLPEATAAKYEITAWPEKRNSTRVVFHKFGLVDFSKLHVSRADQLYKQKFPHLKKKTASK